MLRRVPVGSMDDVAAPPLRIAMSLFTRLPKVGKIGVGAAPGAASESALAHHFSQPKGGDEQYRVNRPSFLWRTNFLIWINAWTSPQGLVEAGDR